MNGGLRPATAGKIADCGLNGARRRGRGAAFSRDPKGSAPAAPAPPRRAAIRNGRGGAALVLAVFAIAFIAAMAVALLDGATTELAIHRNHTLGLEALCAARAGVAQTVAALRQQYNRTSAVVGSLTAPDGTAYSWTAQIDNAAPRVTVTSTGTAAGYTRKVQARMLVAGPPMAAPYPVRIVWCKEVFGS
jgi:hypothetical protein